MKCPNGLNNQDPDLTNKKTSSSSSMCWTFIPKLTPGQIIEMSLMEGRKEGMKEGRNEGRKE